MWETWVRSLDWEDPWEKEKATHSSILAWRMPWTVPKSRMQLSDFHFQIACHTIHLLQLYSWMIFSKFVELYNQCACSVALSCRTLCDPMDYSPPGSSVHGIIPARILEWVAISSSRGPSRPRRWTWVSCGSCGGRRILYHRTSWKSPIVNNAGVKPWVQVFVWICICVSLGQISEWNCRYDKFTFNFLKSAKLFQKWLYTSILPPEMYEALSLHNFWLEIFWWIGNNIPLWVFFFHFLNWRIIALQNFVFFCQTSTWTYVHEYMYIYIYMNICVCVCVYIYIYIYIYILSLLNLPPHPTPLGWYRAPVWVSWAIQQIPIGYLFYIW